MGVRVNHLSARDIISLLATKHAKDLFVPECKNGSTWFNNAVLKLDAWVMKRSWAKPLAIGYEIKVARNDFVRDAKWPGYLEYCNEFYFVCPAGLIQPNEIGDQTGLYWTSKNGKILYLKKKAPYRDIEIPPELYVYILMCRTEIVATTVYDGKPKTDAEKTEYWQNWLKGRTADKDLGWRVSKAIQEKVDQVERESDHLRRENKQLQEIKEFCEKLGVVNFHTPWRAEDQIHNALKGVPEGFIEGLDNCIRHLSDIRGKLI
jgi:hypothetical protein